MTIKPDVRQSNNVSKHSRNDRRNFKNNINSKNIKEETYIISQTVSMKEGRRGNTA
jgi:ribosomal protein L28